MHTSSAYFIPSQQHPSFTSMLLDVTNQPQKRRSTDLIQEAKQSGQEEYLCQVLQQKRMMEERAKLLEENVSRQAQLIHMLQRELYSIVNSHVYLQQHNDNSSRTTVYNRTPTLDSSLHFIQVEPQEIKQSIEKYYASKQGPKRKYTKRRSKN